MSPKNNMSHGCKRCNQRRNEFCMRGGDVFKGPRKWTNCRLMLNQNEQELTQAKSPNELIEEARHARNALLK